MITVSKNRVFALSNTLISHVFRVTKAGLLESIHHGPPVRDPDRLSLPLHTPRECSVEFEGFPDLNLNILPSEYPEGGTSDFRKPAFSALAASGGRVFNLRYAGHKIECGKPGLSPLPSARGANAETLYVSLRDPLSGLRAELRYTVWPDHPVIARSVEFINEGHETLTLQRVMSAALDLPPGDYDALHLHGSWSREMTPQRLPLPCGIFEISSNRGTSSAAHAPYLAVMERSASETAGRVFASTLVYSGNHAFTAETSEFGDVRLLCGLNPDGFSWTLEPAERFQTPEALQLFTDQGLRGMSHAWHNFIRDYITPERFVDMPRPSYLNTWEAAYFGVDETRVLALADSAVELGVEMLVLDDGWFEGRRDDTSSLGDWTADKTRFPNGISALAKKVAQKGLKFGIWFEPEMVNPNSALYRAHPDWILHQTGRTPSLGRNQLTLDLSREDVQNYLFESLSAILSGGNISYVKWDMNRAMTEVGSARLPAARQNETAHRYMLGLYSLLTRLMTAFPDILFENCASGGNRFDLGMLSFMPQSWTSDMVDPVGRKQIISGASLFLPTDVMAAYIGPSPNHQNGRVTSLRTRYLAGVMCAAHGISLNIEDIAADLAQLQAYIRFSKQTAAQRLGASFTRLIDTDNASCWQMISRDGSHVWVLDLHVLASPNSAVRRARLAGLDPSADYELIDDGYGLGDQDGLIGQTLFGGDALMSAGLTLPYVTTNQRHSNVRYAPRGDFAAHLFIFEKR